MSRSTRDEERLLTRDENELVAQTRQAAICRVDDSNLADLIRRLRERRDRARDIAKKQRREIRGKALGGDRAASDDTGSRAKRDVLAAALKRANKERERRRIQSARGSLQDNAKRALAMRQAAEELRQANNPANQDRTAGEGMRNLPHADAQPSGALNAEGHEPVVHRTRLPR